MRFDRQLPDTAGIPAVVQDLTLIAPFNDLEALEAIARANADDLAAVIIEPIQRIIRPRPGFLNGVREIARR